MGVKMCFILWKYEISQIHLAKELTPDKRMLYTAALEKFIYIFIQPVSIL
jgi:hypothetical protein